MGTIGEGREQLLEFAGFWRRIGAAIIDSVILGAVGWVAASAFSDQLSLFGQQARFIGLPVALAYFALGNSRLCGGTPGKHFFDIVVVNRDGRGISLPKASLRAFVYLIPLYANGYDFSFLGLSPLVNEIVQILQSFLIFGVLFGSAYLYLANRPARQVVHDLVSGTFVVRNTGAEWTIDAQVKRVHLVVVAALFVLSLAAVPIASLFGARLQQALGADFAAMTRLQSVLNQDPDILSTGVQTSTLIAPRTNSPSVATKFLIVTVTHRGRPDMPEAFADHVAGRVLTLYPDALGQQQLTIVVAYGFDIGIASRWNSNRYVFSLEQWRARLHSQAKRE